MLNVSAMKRGVRERVFINSMSDFFEDRRDLDQPRRAFFEIVSKLSRLDLLLLTKRPECIVPFLRDHTDHDVIFTAADTLASEWLDGRPPNNVWLGVTAEDQGWASRRAYELLRIPAAVRFLSVEPMLSAIDLRRLYHDQVHFSALEHGKLVEGRVDWVICGGESGPKSRPMHPDWARDLRDHCSAYGIPFFFKQWGEWGLAERGTEAPCVWMSEDGKRESGATYDPPFDHGAKSWALLAPFGKEQTGRSLDGLEHSEFPASFAGGGNS